MKATTIKLEGKILNELNARKPPRLSLTGYVKEILQKDLEKQVLREAAEKYVAFLEENPEEKRAMEEWEVAPLATPPQPRKKK